MAASKTEVESLAQEIIRRVQSLVRRTTPNIRSLRREYTKRLAKRDPKFMLALAHRLIKEPDFDFRFVAYELIAHHRATLTSLAQKDVERLGRGIDSWYDVDTFAPYIAGPVWRMKQVPDKVVHAWARSKDLWWRRTALVCTVALNNKARGGTGDTRRTLAVCKLLVKDREDMVVKAMSWALRELAKRDPEAVHAFIDEHENDLAARVLREVRNKLSTGLKNPRKKAGHR